MLAEMFLVYATIGSIVAIVTSKTFPPEGNYTPSVGLRVFSAATFVALWPLLVLLAVWWSFVCQVDRLFQPRKANRRLAVPMIRSSVVTRL